MQGRQASKQDCPKKDAPQAAPVPASELPRPPGRPSERRQQAAERLAAAEAKVAAWREAVFARLPAAAARAAALQFKTKEAEDDIVDTLAEFSGRS